LYFNDVLSGLVSYALARDEQEGVNEEVRVENSDVAMRLLKEQRSRKLPRAITKQKILESEGELSIDMIIASVVIQSYFRRVIRNRRQKEGGGDTKKDVPAAEVAPPPVESPANAADVKPAVEDSPKAAAKEAESSSDNAAESSSSGITAVAALKGPADIIAQKSDDNVPGQVNPRSSSEDAGASTE